jgi:hypothetical protein
VVGVGGAVGAEYVIEGHTVDARIDETTERAVAIQTWSDACDLWIHVQDVQCLALSHHQLDRNIELQFAVYAVSCAR